MTSPPDNRPKRPSMAGGFLLAVSIMAGTIIGGLLGQPSLGLLMGTAIGIAIGAAIWLVDRKR